MVRVLVFLSRLTHTSIPLDVASRIAAQTDTEVTVVSFYDDDPAECEVDPADVSGEVRLLGADSRFDVRAWREFHRELRRDYDLLHTHHNFIGSVARVLAVIGGVPVVDTEHRNHDSFSALQNAVNGATLSLADVVVSNSAATRSSLRRYETISLDPEDLRVVHNGVDYDRIRTVAESTGRARESTGRHRIVTVARLIPVKNHATLLHAFDRLSDRIDAELVVVGDGPLRNDLESLAADLDVADRTRFTGTVPRSRVYELYGTSDVFAIASRSEGFCVAAVEAMAAGLPVVASDIEVFEEVLDGCGTLADRDEPTAFASAIEELLLDADRRDRLGSECRERARETFSLDACAERYNNIYTELANLHQQ